MHSIVVLSLARFVSAVVITYAFLCFRTAKMEEPYKKPDLSPEDYDKYMKVKNTTPIIMKGGICETYQQMCKVMR